MGFEHKQHTYGHDNDDGTISIKTYHYITHPYVPGLFLAHNDLDKLAGQIVWAIKMLTIYNELKVREVQS